MTFRVGFFFFPFGAGRTKASPSHGQARAPWAASRPQEITTTMFLRFEDGDQDTAPPRRCLLKRHHPGRWLGVFFLFKTPSGDARESVALSLSLCAGAFQRSGRGCGLDFFVIGAQSKSFCWLSGLKAGFDVVV